MKIFAMSRRRDGVTPDQIHPHQKAEARRLWELYVDGTVREAHFRQDRPGGVLVLECADVNEARERLQSMPLVRAGLVEFEFIPVGPYSHWQTLFAAVD